MAKDAEIADAELDEAIRRLPDAQDVVQQLLDSDELILDQLEEGNEETVTRLGEDGSSGQDKFKAALIQEYINARLHLAKAYNRDKKAAWDTVQKNMIKW